MSLFGWTCLIGPTGYRFRLQNEARRLWEKGIEADKRLTIEDKAAGFEHRMIIYADGPRADVKWCIPVFPFILVTNSRLSIGPLWGSSGIKVIIYYGFGFLEFDTPWCWVY
jgi:hypothetical protein